jgi:two-component system OmpR family response regulator
MYTASMAKGRVLIVEDEAKIGEITLAYLKRDGYEATHVLNGRDALLEITKGYDLVILDLMLPDMDGEEICRSVREHSNIPIIMVTAKSDEDERVTGLGLGADDYVIKPFSPRELMARVAALLRRTKRVSPTLSFNSGRLVVNVEKMSVKLDGRDVTLTPTEFKLMLALSDRPEVVMSRLQLVNQAQGYGFEGYERTVDAHVKNLRQKIEKEPKNPEFIKTVYGMGYKFIGSKDAD